MRNSHRLHFLSWIIVYRVVFTYQIELATANPSKLYYYGIDMRRKYLSMKFNDYVRVDGDPTGVDITVTWLKDITRSADMELFYMVQTIEGEEIASKFFDLPSLCTGRYSYNSWDRNIMEIYSREMMNLKCPVESGTTISPPAAFTIHLTFNHKIPCTTLQFIMDLYPPEEPDSTAFLLLEGNVHSYHAC
ncbi:uncharacterized protein [Fopius arisanus]|uniref:Uncharacterized protein isoform X1 n=2 Tax=Fopius arisanus TaxID=64838 RepID=A0A9R1THP4_9HYME|nr:PREDICTED: uncharacterized protein LOC105270305 isoform X1 [Fopius arisanus]